MSDINLSTFPSSKYEALTMLYLQNQDLSGLTPEELLEKYQETYDKIYAHRKEVRRTKTSPNWSI